MDDPGLLASLGIKTPDLLAGTVGGLVKAIVFDKSGPTAVISSMIVGAAMANYLADVANKYVGTGVGVSGFIVGMCGMIICQIIVSKATKWGPTLFSKGGADGIGH